jgi:hypothetical protein
VHLGFQPIIPGALLAFLEGTYYNRPIILNINRNLGTGNQERRGEREKAVIGHFKGD